MIKLLPGTLVPIVLLLSSILLLGQGETEMYNYGIKIPDVAPNANSPLAGMIRFNTQTSDFEGYDGSVWKSLTGTPSTSSTPQYAIGDYAQGGIVFWVSPDATQYKVVHIYDFGRSTWRNSGSIFLGASSDSDGEANTNLMVNDPSYTASAADDCVALIEQNYDDWYMPAIDELMTLLDNSGSINPSIVSWSGDELDIDQYWSSTEESSTEAKVYSTYLDPPEVRAIGKLFSNSVRAIRKFTINP